MAVGCLVLARDTASDYCVVVPKRGLKHIASKRVQFSVERVALCCTPSSFSHAHLSSGPSAPSLPASPPSPPAFRLVVSIWRFGILPTSRSLLAESKSATCCVTCVPIRFWHSVLSRPGYMCPVALAEPLDKRMLRKHAQRDVQM